MTKTPDTALSIMQPWSWLIVNGHKDIENRDWRTKRREAVLVHAGQKMDLSAHRALMDGYHPVTGRQAKKLSEAYAAAYLAGEVHTGGIVGQVEITDCVAHSPSDWFVGDFGFVLANAKPLPFRPLKGALQFFKVSDA